MGKGDNIAIGTTYLDRMSQNVTGLVCVENNKHKDHTANGKTFERHVYFI